MRGIHRGPVNSPHKWPATWKIFPFDDVIMNTSSLWVSYCICFMGNFETNEHVVTSTLYSFSRKKDMAICTQTDGTAKSFSFPSWFFRQSSQWWIWKQLNFQAIKLEIDVETNNVADNLVIEVSRCNSLHIVRLEINLEENEVADNLVSDESGSR